jgi:NADH-quinone oxidoreductase subunit G
VSDILRLAERAPQSLSGPGFVSPIKDFYLTNPIARASRVLAECSAMQLGPAAQAAE